MRAVWLWLAVIAGASGLMIGRGSAAEEQAPGELDIVITSRLDTPAEHAAIYREALVKAAGKTFASLNPKIYGADEKPKDGAARYRLVIEVHARGSVGNTPTPVRVRGENRQDRISFQFSIIHEGEITFQFLQWENGKYKRLGGWSVAPDPEAPSRRVEVASAAIDPGRPVPREMPITLEEGRAKALQSLLPRDISRVLLVELFRVQLLDADVREDGDRMRGWAAVEVRNLSPWAVRKLEVSAEWAPGPREAFRITFAHDFPKALPRGQAARFEGDGWTGQADPKRLTPGRVVSAEFKRNDER